MSDNDVCVICGHLNDGNHPEIRGHRFSSVVKMSREDEIKLVAAVISHPAGFDLDFAGGAILIRTTDQDSIEVEWREPPDRDTIPHPCHQGPVKSFRRSQVFEAAAFFVDKRYELQYGLDYEVVSPLGPIVSLK